MAKPINPRTVKALYREAGPSPKYPKRVQEKRGLKEPASLEEAGSKFMTGKRIVRRKTKVQQKSKANANTQPQSKTQESEDEEADISRPLIRHSSLIEDVHNSSVSDASAADIETKSTKSPRVVLEKLDDGCRKESSVLEKNFEVACLSPIKPVPSNNEERGNSTRHSLGTDNEALEGDQLDIGDLLEILKNREDYREINTEIKNMIESTIWWTAEKLKCLNDEVVSLKQTVVDLKYKLRKSGDIKSNSSLNSNLKTQTSAIEAQLTEQRNTIIAYGDKLQAMQSEILRATNEINANNRKLKDELEEAAVVRQLEMKKKIEKIEKAVPSLNKTSYAEALKEKPKSTLVLRPNENFSIREMSNRLRNIACPKEITVEKMNFKQTAMELRCTSESGKEKLKQTLLNSSLREKIEIEDKRPICDRIIVFNLPMDLPENQVTEELRKFDESVNSTHINVIRKLKSWKDGMTHWVIQLPRKIANEVLSRGFFFYGLRKMFLDKFITMRRCKRCQSFQHLEKDCGFKLYCGFCSEEHDASECKAQKPKCVNCCLSNKYEKSTFNTSHTADYPHCPTYRGIMEDRKMQCSKTNRLQRNANKVPLGRLTLPPRTGCNLNNLTCIGEEQQDVNQSTCSDREEGINALPCEGKVIAEQCNKAPQAISRQTNPLTLPR